MYSEVGDRFIERIQKAKTPKEIERVVNDFDFMEQNQALDRKDIDEFVKELHKKQK